MGYHTKYILLHSLTWTNWQAKTETVQKVCDIVRKQLALPAETDVTPQTKFAELGADSLDTVS